MNYHLNAKTRCLNPGAPKLPEYAVWRAMLRRCRNPNTKDYPHYGGRGIKVCDRWNVFENFLQDLGLRPEGMTLERKDTNGNYSPKNCKWASWEENQNNRRDSTLVSFRGEVKTISQWSRVVGVPERALRKRFVRGWSAEDALTKPLRTI